MQEQELTALVGKTAALMEQFERRCLEIARRQQALTQSLQQLAQQIPAAVRQSADQSLQSLPGQLLGKVERGLEAPVTSYQKRLQEAGGLLGDGSRTLAAQIQRLEKLHKHLIWKTVTAVAASLALVLAGGLWLATHYAKVIRENRLSAELVQMYNRADVTVCGERLCANVDMRAKPVGPQRQYRPVQARIDSEQP